MQQLVEPLLLDLPTVLSFKISFETWASFSTVFFPILVLMVCGPHCNCRLHSWFDVCTTLQCLSVSNHDVRWAHRFAWIACKKKMVVAVFARGSMCAQYRPECFVGGSSQRSSTGIARNRTL